MQTDGRYERERGSVHASLITRTTALDPSSLDANPETLSARDLQTAAVRAALSQLPPEQREALEVAYFEDLTYSELALSLDPSAPSPGLRRRQPRPITTTRPRNASFSQATSAGRKWSSAAETIWPREPARFTLTYTAKQEIFF